LTAAPRDIVTGAGEKKLSSAETDAFPAAVCGAVIASWELQELSEVNRTARKIVRLCMEEKPQELCDCVSHIISRRWIPA
jgi:hypothetical protein